MKKMRIILTGIVMLATVWKMQAQTQTKSGNEFTIPLSDPSKRGMLKAHVNYGSITIKGTARKDVLVKYSEAKEEDEEQQDEREERDHKKRIDVKVNLNINKNDGGNDSNNGLKKISGSGLELDASENNNVIKVSSDSWNNKTNLEIEVPAGMDLTVGAYNDGDIIITNIEGEVELNSYNGPITALNISGSVVATTYNGDLKVTFDKVSDGKPMSYSTYNGDVDLTFPATAKATFKMKTERGDIYTGFDMNVTSSGPVKQQDSKSGGYKLKIDEWKRGDINGGGAEFTLKNYNGDIYIRKR